MLDNHEQAIAALYHNVDALTQSITNRTQRMERQGSPSHPHPPPVQAAVVAPTSPSDAYMCDPEPFDRDIDKCRGFLLQCRLVFSQHPRMFPSDAAKINYVIGLLQGRVLVWAQTHT